MPSPFPGMDPYLERCGYWRTFHHGLIVNIMRALNRGLPEGFAADIGGRVIPTDADEEVTDPFINVLALKRPEKTVAVIEVLSPEDKEPGGARHEAYLKHQRERIAARVPNLVEIDLLREGTPTIALFREGQGLFPVTAAGAGECVVSIHRTTCPEMHGVARSRLRDALPTFFVPLTTGPRRRHTGSHVALNLQAALDAAYDDGPYNRVIRYEADPTPPLSRADAAWADALLRGKGLRP